MRWNSLCFFCLFLLLSACGLQEREQALADRESRLARREQELLERENQLTLKEEELLKIAQPADTTRADTTQYNPDILGSWNAVMTCIETNCPGSAVGDTKSEVWNFSYENNYLVAKAMVGNKVTRIYSGSFTGTRSLELTANVEPAANAPATRLVVRLTATPRNTLEGQREILRQGGCRIIYSLQLTR